MHILELTVADREKDFLIAELYDLGTQGVMETERPEGLTLLQAFFAEPFDALQFAPYAPRWQTAESRDWVGEFETSWQPIEVGERFWLVPHWMESRTPPEGRIALAVYPGMACGTGRHPATQLCLMALEHVLKPGVTVIDVGTGTGILSAAATLLGAGCVCACDIDHDAVAIAAANLAGQRLDATLWIGSLRSVRSCVAHVIVANINAEGVRGLAADIVRVLKPGGVAVVSGFVPADRNRALEPFEKHPSISIAAEHVHDNWIAITLKRRDDQ